MRQARIFLLDSYFPPFCPNLDEFDAKKIVRVAKFYHINAIRFGAMGNWCVLQQHIMPKDPNLGERDLLKEMIESAHAEKIRVIVYIPTLHMLPIDNVLENHPDWAFRRSLKPNDYPYYWGLGFGRYVALCYNTGYRETYIKFFKYIVTNYDIDATYTDCLNPYNFGGKVCYCLSCQKSFKEMFNRPIPYFEDEREYTQKDKNQLDEFGKWRGKFVHEITNELISFVGKVKKIPMLTHGQSLPPGMTDRNLAIKHVSLLFEAGGDIRHRIETVTYCISMGKSALQYVGNHGRWSKVCLNRKEIARESAVTLLAGGSVIVAGTPQFIYPFPNRVNKTLQQTYAFFSKHEKLFEGLNPVFFSAIPWSSVDRSVILPENFPDPAKNGYAVESHITNLENDCRRGAFSALLSMHLPVHLVEDEVLNEPERLAKFRVLVLPNVGYLSNKQQNNIRNYVRNGGSLLASYATSLYDSDGQLQKNFGLADVFGVDLRKPSDEESRNLYYHYGRGPAGPIEVYNRTLKKEDFILPAGPFLYTKIHSDAKVIANIVYDCGTDAVTPGIVFNQFGKGKVVYISHVPEWLYFNGPDPALLDLFRTLLTLLVSDGFPIEVSGPASLFAFLSEKEEHIVLSLVNYTGETFDGTGNLAQTRIDYIPAIPEINFRVRLPEKTKPTCVKALVSNKTLKTDFKNNYVCGKIKNVEIFEVIDISYRF